MPDEKFSRHLMDNFNQTPERHVFLLFPYNYSGEYRFVFPDHTTILPFHPGKDNMERVLSKFNPSAIILHSMNPGFARELTQLKPTLPVCLIPWGYDLYERAGMSFSLYAPGTLQFLKQRDPLFILKRWCKKYRLFRFIYYQLLHRNEDIDSKMYDSFRMITHLATWIRPDFILFQSHFHSKAIHLDVPFISIEQYLYGDDQAVLNHDARHVLLGNSNSATSNMLDAIPIIAPFIEESQNVFATLSYGEQPGHREEVIKTGKSKLEDRFIPVVDFLSGKDFITLLKSCIAGVFMHYRQQAMGTMIAMLYLGSRIYLSEKNPILSSLRDSGFKISSLEHDFQNTLWTPLSLTEKNQNRSLIDKKFNSSAVNEQLSHLINTLCNH